MRNRHFHTNAIVLIGLLFAVFGCDSTDTRPAESPLPAAPVSHLIWITFDALRADHLELYGYPLNTAPQLTQWAKPGVLFDRCIAQGVNTVESTKIMVFGQYAHTINLKPDDPGYRLNRSLLHILSENGYKTALWSNHGAFPLPGQFALFTDNGKATEMQTAKEALQWQAEHAQEKTFLWIHLFAPHQPQPRQGARFEEFLAARKNRDVFPESFWHIPENLEQTPRPENFHALWAAYDAAIGKSDGALGVFLAGLERNRLLDDSLIAVTADHGEHMDQGGMLNHERWTFRPLVHVPLVLIPPQSLYGRLPEGGRVHQRVRHIDLAPTFLEAAGISTKKDLDLDGVSLFSLDAADELPAFSDGSGSGLPTSRSLEKGHFVLWKTEGVGKPVYQLFDLAESATERQDVRFKHPIAYWRMKREIDAFAPPPANRSSWNTEKMTEQQLNRLKELGYVQ